MPFGLTAPGARTQGETVRGLEVGDGGGQRGTVDEKDVPLWLPERGLRRLLQTALCISGACKNTINMVAAILFRLLRGRTCPCMTGLLVLKAYNW